MVGKINVLFLTILALHLILPGCKDNSKVDRYETENLIIEQLSPHTFLHTSFLETDQWGRVPCNGLIVRGADEVLVIDAPIGKDATQELVDWANSALGCKVSNMVATHFHADALGNLNHFHSIGVESHATNLTIELAKKDGVGVLPLNGFDTLLELDVQSRKVLNVFIGPGHTKDNIISYVPDQKIMFGGCLIKSLGAGKGNLDDADTIAWANTVQRIKEEFPDIKVVIPGHGDYGNSALLDYTIQLFDHRR